MQMMHQSKQLLPLHIRIHSTMLDYQPLFPFALKSTLLLKIKVGNEELSHKITPHMTTFLKLRENPASLLLFSPLSLGARHTSQIVRDLDDDDDRT